MAAAMRTSGTELPQPAAGRRKLRLISFAGGRFRELGTVMHGAAIVTDFVARLYEAGPVSSV